ncbi:hypothetical protein HYV49_04010, partial [Candidatus Pacearchaeota archaeon]|nr:hypothetical protein [Candidatus Pacearchaeota archaeon]
VFRVFAGFRVIFQQITIIPSLTTLTNASKIDLDLLYPTASQVNATQNLFFNVTLNVTCRNVNCGEINVSLDPISELERTSFWAATSLTTGSSNQTLSYRQGGTEINITLTAIVNGNSFNISSLVSNIIQSNSNGYKFAPNITIPGGVQGTLIRNTNNREIQFNISSNAPLETFGNGFRYKSGSVIKGLLIEDRYVIYDFSDILNSFKITTNISTFNESGDAINITINQSIPIKIDSIDSNIIINFNFSQVSLSNLNNIFLDPTITIDDVDSYASTKNNITTEAYPLAHITTNDSSLVLYMPFDVNHTSPANITYDYSPYNNNGIRIQTAAGRINWIPSSSNSIYGGYYNFSIGNGVNDRIEVEGSSFDPASNGNLTISVWVKATGDYADFRGIVSKQNGFSSSTTRWIFYAESGAVTFRGFTGNVDSFSYGLPANQWVHLVVVANGTNRVLYVNGTTRQNLSAITFGDGTTSDIMIGNTGNSDMWSGGIEEVMIFNRSLSANEISAIYNNQSYRYKTPASMIFNYTNISISQDGTLNRVNVTTNATLLMNTNISLRLLGYNQTGSNIENTTPQNISDGDNKITNFSISTSVYNISLEFTFLASSNGTDVTNFYSPILRDNIIIESFAVAGGAATKSGLVSTTTGATPFYTNESNPRNITLNAGQSQLVTFWVNATGTIGTNHTFFAYANRTSAMTTSNITSKWNVTITSAPGGNVFSANVSASLAFTSLLTRLTGTLRLTLLNFNINDIIARILLGLRNIYQLLDLNDMLIRVLSALRSIFQLIDINDAVNILRTVPRAISQLVDINDAVFRTFVGLRNTFQVVDLNDNVARFITMTKAASQLIDINDATARIFLGLRSVADLIDINEAMFRNFGVLRNIAQSIDITDAIFRIFIGARSSFQLIDINDAVFRIFGGGRIISQSLDINDAVIRIFIGLRGATQIVDLNDAVFRLRTVPLAIYQLIDINDAVFRVFAGFRVIFQLIDINENIVSYVAIPRAIGQVIDINDNVARVLAALRGISLNIDINDSIARIFAGTRGIFQILDINDAVARVLSAFRSVFQIIDINDSATATLIDIGNLFSGNVSQTFSINAFTQRTYLGTRSIFAVGDINDAMFRVFIGTKGIFQLVDLSDATFRLFTGFRNVFQIVDLNDAVFRIFVGLRNISQLTDINDFVVRLFTGFRNVFQVTDINDAVFRMLAGFRTSSQQITLNAILTTRFGVLRNVVQLVDLNDSVTRIFAGFRGITQLIDINDSIAKFYFGVRGIAQIVDLNDAATKVFGSLIRVFQLLDINDATVRIFIGARNIAQLVDLNDAVYRLFIGTKGIFQVIDIQDSITRILSAFRSVFQTFSINEFITATFTDIGNLLSREVFDTFSINQLVSTTILRVRYLPQSINVNILLARTFAGFRNVFALLDLNDAFARFVAIPRLIAQVVDLNDSVIKVFIGARGIFQLFDINDAVFRTFVGFRSVFQIIDLNDAVTKFVTISRTINHIIDINDAVFRIFNPVRSIAQNININAIAFRVIFIFKSIVQLINANIVTGRFITIPRNVNQGFSILTGFSFTTFNVFIVDIYQSIRIDIALNRIAILFRNIFDVIRQIFGLPGLEAAPTPSPSPSESPAPSGGGGSLGKRIVKSFYIDKKEIFVKLKLGETGKAFFSVINNGTEALNFVVRRAGLREYVTQNPRVFSLAPNESEGIDLIITAPQEPGTYTSTIIVEAEGIIQETLLIIEVETAEKLFDVVLDIPTRYKEVRAGSDIFVTMEIINLGEEGRVDVLLTYYLKDLNNNILFSYSETLAVDTKTSIVREIKIPNNFKPGRYVLAADVIYKNIVSTSSSVITIKEKINAEKIVGIMVSVIITVAISLLVYNLYNMLKKLESKKKARALAEELRRKGILLPKKTRNKNKKRTRKSGRIQKSEPKNKIG